MPWHSQIRPLGLVGHHLRIHHRFLAKAAM